MITGNREWHLNILESYFKNSKQAYWASQVRLDTALKFKYDNVVMPRPLTLPKHNVIWGNVQEIIKIQIEYHYENEFWR